MSQLNIGFVFLLLAAGTFVTYIGSDAGVFPFGGLAMTGYALYLIMRHVMRSEPKYTTVTNNWSASPSPSIPTGDTSFRTGDYSPSRQRGYDRLLSIFNAHEVVGLSPDQAAVRLTSFFGSRRQAKALVNHPNVIALLGLNTEPGSSDPSMSRHDAPARQAPGHEAWWKTEEDPTRQAVSGQTEPEASDSNDVANSTGIFWSSDGASQPRPSTSAQSPVGTSNDEPRCGLAECDRTVTAFDYRCRTCGLRFCMSHRGSGVDCRSCVVR